jgi:hypothetical protein
LSTRVDIVIVLTTYAMTNLLTCIDFRRDLEMGMKEFAWEFTQRYRKAQTDCKLDMDKLNIAMLLLDGLSIDDYKRVMSMVKRPLSLENIVTTFNNLFSNDNKSTSFFPNQDGAAALVAAPDNSA